MKLTSEQRPIFNQAAYLYSLASGVSGAAAVESLEADPTLLAGIAAGLREMSPVSPLADEIEALAKE